MDILEGAANDVLHPHLTILHERRQPEPFINSLPLKHLMTKRAFSDKNSIYNNNTII